MEPMTMPAMAPPERVVVVDEVESGMGVLVMVMRVVVVWGAVMVTVGVVTTWGSAGMMRVWLGGG